MQDIYVTEGSIGREDIFYYRLLEGFNLPPIAAKAIVEMGREFFLKDNDTPGKIGQCKYIAIADTEGPGKQKKDAEHKEISITIDVPEDLVVYTHTRHYQRHRTNISQSKNCRFIYKRLYTYRNRKECKTFNKKHRAIYKRFL